MIRIKHYIAVALLMLVAHTASAQCTFHNDAFQSGEFLSYNLYYNWKFVWVKAGTASMYTVATKYKGKNAYRSSLITRGNKRVDDMFVLRDTLLCYSTYDMAPLYFRKGAREGKRYNVDEVYYSYPNGKCHVAMSRLHTDGKLDRSSRTSDSCIFDMLNIFMRARSFNPTSWKRGAVVNFPLVDGKDVVPAMVKYRGKSNIKADDGHTYRCLELSYIEKDDGKWKEISRFYVSDDSNHVPIRLDMYLRFGSAKAFLVGVKGLRNPTAARVK
jgi:hypothetical protein